MIIFLLSYFFSINGQVSYKEVDLFNPISMSLFLRLNYQVAYKYKSSRIYKHRIKPHQLDLRKITNCNFELSIAYQELNK